MSFSVEGDYFETCNCEVSCPCIWLKPADKDACDLMLAWHVSKGEKDGLDLSDMNAVMALHSPKQMTDGGWKVALYLDDRATPEQSEALGAVFSGGAGGHLAALGPLISEVVGVAPASITFDRSNGSLRAEVASVLTMSAEELTGMDGENPSVITNPLLGVVTQPTTQAKAGDVSYHGHWDVEYSGTNSFVADFKYEG
ncbi:MAG TPA: DUF1326 domain-containing protein [Acidimicrobiia bacterium]|nr:DUF1326 domain-containing protein [Acidimicrobiia bacterium]